MNNQRLGFLVLVVLFALALGAACGGSSSSQRIAEKTAKGPAPTRKLPPVKPEAMREFETGLRAIRLTGKEPSADAYAKADERFRAAVALDDKLWEAWYNLGVVGYRQGNDDAAVDAFTKALDVNPAHTESMLGRAEAHRRAGRFKQARADYENAIAKSPDDSPIRGNASARLAGLLREVKEYKDALGVIRNTLRTSGANATVYVELGRLYMAQGRNDLAALVLTKAAELNPKEPSIYNAQALLALSRGDAQEAFDRFDYATSLDPNYLDARFNKAAVLLDAGDFARAKDELSKVVAQDPADLSAQVALGVALRGLGEYDQAKAKWEQVIQGAGQRSPERSDALFNLAMLQLTAIGDEKAAKAELERFLQEAPANHPKRKEAEEKKRELGI